MYFLGPKSMCLCVQILWNHWANWSQISCGITVGWEKRWKAYSNDLGHSLFIHYCQTPGRGLLAGLLTQIWPRSAGLWKLKSQRPCYSNDWCINNHSDRPWTTGIISALQSENMSYAICEQQRHRSNCAPTQFDQHLCYSLPWHSKFWDPC